MTKRYLIFFSIFILFILTIGMSSAADDLSEHISEDISIDSSYEELSIESDNSDDSNSDPNLNAAKQVDEKRFDAIQNAIAQASENDTIILNGTYTATGKNMIIVNKAITIQGVNNAILDGNHFKVRFRIDSPNVCFKDVTFRNFKFDDDESGIIITKNGITVSNCNFKDNRGNITAIYASGGTCKITNCAFSNNANNFGTIYLENAQANIYNSSFKNSRYVSKENEREREINGDTTNGLIYSLNSKITVSNSNFYNNKIRGLSITESTCSISNCIFNNSEIAIDSAESNLTIKSSLFTKLKSGILLYGGKNTINACNFINNSGVPVKLGGFEFSTISNLINNSNFINNTNKYGPSAIYVYYDSAKIINCNFKNNSGLNEEGVIFIETHSPVTITKSNKTRTFKNPSVLDNSLKDYPYIGYVIKSSFTTSYKSGKLFTGKVIYGFNKKILDYFDGVCYITKGKKEYAEDYRARIKIDFSKYPVGKYKALFVVCPDGSEDSVLRDIYGEATIKIVKAKTIVKAPKVKFRYKKTRYFKVTIKNKETKKVMKGLKLKIKVYTGKKYRSYTVKTNKKGVAKLNTKKLKRGKHKVIIRSGNKNCSIYKKSEITIK